MSRSSLLLSFRAGLLLATLPIAISSGNPARSMPQQHLDLYAQTSIATPQSSPKPVDPKAKLTPGNTTETKPGSIGPVQEPRKQPTSATTTQEPVEAIVNLVLKLKERRVYVYKGDKPIAKYPVAIGKKGWETPTGEWQVMEKIRNPAWTSFKTGEVFAAGTENPLGSRWIGFWTDGQDVIGFHGTPNVKSIGTAASHGCVRMRNRDVKALFRLVKVGTVVKVE
jgi:lipoprotein-anchoring transpeptidase ErfK/SrfK